MKSKSQLTSHHLLIAGIFGGKIKSPFSQFTGTSAYRSVETGLPLFISNIVRLLTIAAGLFALVNILLAAIDFMHAGGDAQKITNAWNKIWRSLVGLAIAASAILLVSLVSWLLFGNTKAILQPTITGPGTP
jgi:hypothetical protein